jgi:hypothetical protein
MSITDRLSMLPEKKRATASVSQPVTASTTLVVVDPVAKRISGLLKELGVLFKGMQNRDWLTRQLGIILDAVREEIEEDDSVFADPTSSLWIRDFAKLMDWTATGDYSVLPEHLISIACNIEGRPIPVKSNWAYTAKNPDLAGQRIELPVGENASH